MRAPAAIRLERFQKLIQQLEYESEKGSPIIVEGVRDRESLRTLGIAGKILCIQSSRRNTLGFVEELGTLTRVIVLTDFDREGVSLAKKLNRTLNAHGAQANLIIWRSLRELTRSDVRSIQELPKYRDRLQTEDRIPPHAPFVHEYRHPHGDRRGKRGIGT